MPILPDARGQVSPTPTPGGSVTPITPSPGFGFAENAASTLSASGADLQKAALIIAATNDRQDQQTALNAANKLHESAIQLQFSQDNGFQNANGEQAVGKQFTDKYGQLFKDQAGQIRNSLASDNQKRIFDQHADVLRSQFQSGLLRHQAQETERFNDQTDDSALKLQLRSMAQDPVNDLNFHTGMVKINGIIDNLGKRKGLAPEQVENLKATYADAAHAARITSVMEGIPGVVQANPRAAEAMFKQVQGQLGPQVQQQLARQLNAAVMDVDARDLAHSAVYDDKTGSPVSANQLKVDVFRRVEAARSEAEKLRPGDPKFADAVAARVQNYAHIIISNQQAQEANARDTLVSGMIGSKPDGSAAPQTVDQLLANPQMKQAWNTATPETKQAIQSHFKNGGGSPARTQDTQALLYRYMGKAAMNREEFAQEDLSGLISKLPYSDFDKLANLQLASRNRQDRDAEKNANFQHALNLGLNFALKPMGISTPTPNTSSSKREQYEQFTGRLYQWMNDFQDANKRPPNDKEIISQAKNLTATVTTPGAFWNSDKAAFSLSPDEEARATVKLEDKDRSRITATLQRRYGFAPTEPMIQQAAIYERLYPTNMEKWKTFDQTMREHGKKRPPTAADRIPK